MNELLRHGLSKRERQIMEALYRLKSAGVAEVRREIPRPPSYSAVRATLNILERKGILVHRPRGQKYLYSPAIPRARARRGALRQLLVTYFENSVSSAVAALIQAGPEPLSDADCQRILHLIEESRNGTKR